MAELFENIKKLCLADGTSGDEGDVTKLILSMLPQECDAKIDPLGNICGAEALLPLRLRYRISYRLCRLLRTVRMNNPCA